MNQDDKSKITDAIAIIIRFGGIDGSHHKTWVLDQALRALTGCECTSRNDGGAPEGFAKNTEYEQLIFNSCCGEDGPYTYEHDEGVAP